VRTDKQAINEEVGFIGALFSAFFWGIHLLPVKLVKTNSIDFMFPMTFGIFLFAWLLFLLVQRRLPNPLCIEARKSMLAGFIWAFGNLFAILAVLTAGFAKGFPLTQLSVLVALAWSVLYFREIRDKRSLIILSCAIAIIIVGVVILSNTQV